MAQLYRRIELLEAEVCAHAGRQEQSEGQVSSLVKGREEAQQRADELYSQLQERERVRADMLQ